MADARQRSRSRRRPDSFRIAVMGEAGVGKTSFIRRLTGRGAVNQSIDSGPQRLEVYDSYIRSPNGRLRYNVKFVDCPGFGNIDDPDGHTIDAILTWLRQEYGRGRKLHGIIYMVNLNRPRFTGFSLRNIDMFRDLIGPDFYKNVILGTSFWDEVTEDVGRRREHELESSEAIWGQLVRRGAQMRRIGRAVYTPNSTRLRTIDSDLAIVWEIARNHPDFVAAQREMANGTEPSGTTARQTYDRWNQYYEQKARMDAELEQDQRDYDANIARRRTGLQSERRRRERAMNEEITAKEADLAAQRVRRDENQRERDRLADAALAANIGGLDIGGQLNSRRERRQRDESEVADLEATEARTAKRLCARFRRKAPDLMTCSKPGCSRRIPFRREDHYHCCFCDRNDDYDQCLRCGSQCKSTRHPPMVRITPADWERAPR